MPTPTGRLEAGEHGRDLVLVRTFDAPVEDVWASITESERTARWFASWSGDAGPGRTIRYRLEHEEGKPEGDMVIDACEAPHHLAVSSVDEHGSWHLEAHVQASADGTVLRFVHHLDDATDPSTIGPGWEYYLDMLVASRTGGPPPSFDDYYPSQAEHYGRAGHDA